MITPELSPPNRHQVNSSPSAVGGCVTAYPIGQALLSDNRSYRLLTPPRAPYQVKISLTLPTAHIATVMSSFPVARRFWQILKAIISPARRAANTAPPCGSSGLKLGAKEENRVIMLQYSAGHDNAARLRDAIVCSCCKICGSPKAIKLRAFAYLMWWGPSPLSSELPLAQRQRCSSTARATQHLMGVCAPNKVPLKPICAAK